MQQDHPDRGDVVQFNLRSLFLLTFLCALAITLVRGLEIGGTVLLFLAGAISTWVMRTRCDIGTRRFWFQAIWGVLLPLACIFTDPFVFRSFDFGGGNGMVSRSISVGCYGFMTCEMVLLCASWFLSPKSSVWAALMSGGLLAGTVFAAVVAICLAPLALLFAISLVGLPGFTPWFTMVAYGNAFRRSWRVASHSPNRTVIFGLAGMGAAAPIAVGLAASLNGP